MLKPLSILAILVLAGCNGVKSPTDYAPLGLVQISGQVLVEGEPLSGGSVIFEAHDKTYSAGDIDSSGHYQLRFNSEQMGVTPGSKSVRISSRSVPSENDEGADPDAQPQSEDAVPSCYNKSSDILVIVDALSTSFDFDLKKDCSTTSSK